MAEYLRYVLKNTEALRVADGETSQSGQTSAVRYIPGTAVKGLVVNSLAKDADFEEIKQILFSESFTYLNAYPIVKGHSLIPSPKGFYEDKTIVEGKKEIQNVVLSGDFSDGMKRAALGSFSYMEDGCIYYYSVKTASDMKILINFGEGQKRNVFRLEMLAPGQVFEGFIRLSGIEDLDKRICDIFKKDSLLKIGNARSSGLGSCKVLFSERKDRVSAPGNAFSAKEECYMMLLSDTVMRDEYGEYCGLYLPSLEKKLGVENLRIKYASSSVRMIHGYNRTIGGKRPTLPAYAAGSVFHLLFDGCIEEDKMRSLTESGIGVRRNEGMGRICFLKDYEQIHQKMPGSCAAEADEGSGLSKGKLTSSELQTLNTAAKGYYRNVLEDAMEHYILEHPLKKNGVKNSQLGQIEARLLEFRYDPKAALENLDGYFGHADEKEKNQKIQKERASLSLLRNQVMDILRRPIEETLFEGKEIFRNKGTVMGIPVKNFFPEEEDARYRIKLLVRMIRFDRKEG